MQTIIPNLWFNKNAKEAVDFYLSVFPDSKIIHTMYYPKTAEEGLADFQKDFAGEVLTIEFELSGQRFIAINADDTFKPTEALSLMIPCKDQEEINHYWHTLIADGGEESVCGWLKDKYGYSWQVCPQNWSELLQKSGAFEKMMGMKKLVIADF